MMQHARKKTPFVTLVWPYLMLCGYTLYSYADGRELPFQRILYGAMGVSFAIAAIQVSTLIRGYRKQKLLMTWLALIGLFSVNVLWQQYKYPGWILADIAGVALPLLMLCTGLGRPGLFSSAAVNLFFAFHVVCAFIAPVMYQLVHAGDRFMQPHIVAFVYLWSRFFKSGSFRGALLTALAIVLLLGLAFLSTQRTNVILGLLVGPVLGVIQRSRFHRLLLLAAIIGVPCAIYAIANPEIVDGFIGSSRFSKLDGGLDDSILNRFEEIQDIQYVVETEWNFLNYILGAGYGASFEPIYLEKTSFIEHWSVHGRQHNIHIFPAQVFYRYGIAGVTIWVICLCGVLRRLFQLIRNGCGTMPSDRTESIVSMSMALMLGYGLLFPILPDPTFSYVWAAFVYRNYCLTRKQSMSPVPAR